MCPCSASWRSLDRVNLILFFLEKWEKTRIGMQATQFLVCCTTLRGTVITVGSGTFVWNIWMRKVVWNNYLSVWVCIKIKNYSNENYVIFPNALKVREPPRDISYVSIMHLPIPFINIIIHKTKFLKFLENDYFRVKKR